MNDKHKHTLSMTSKTIIFILIIMVLLLVSIFNYYLNTKKQNISVQTQETKIIFNDKGNHFSVSIPSSWTGKSDYGKQTIGIGTDHEEVTAMEISNVSLGNTGINFSVYEKAPACETVKKPNSKLAGIPAYYNSDQYSWTIYTNDSTLVAGYYYPGLKVFRGRLNAISVSQGEMKINQQKINDIISTFKLKSSQPLVCP